MISDGDLYNLSLKFGVCLFVLILVYGFINVNFLEENAPEQQKHKQEDELLSDDDNDDDESKLISKGKK